MIRKAERDHYQQLLNQNKSNLRKVWSLIKVVFNKSKNNSISDKFLINNNNVTDKNVTASNFNEYFISIGPTLAKKIPTRQRDLSTYITSSIIKSIYLDKIVQEEDN